MPGTASPNMDRAEYEESLKVFWDFSNVLSTAERKGRAEGRAEGRVEGRAEGERNEKLRSAKNFKTLGVDVETISKATGLTKEEIESL